MPMIDDVKQALRVYDTSLDAEITDIIAAARADLILVGVLSTKANADNDAMIKRAIITYAKAEFGYDDQTSLYREAYNMLKGTLSLSQTYTVAP